MLSHEKRTRPYGPTTVTDHQYVNSNQANPTMYPEHQQHIWIITGPAGCGKSTVASFLAKQLSLPFIEGDDYHSIANKEKMGKGIPLTDADRWDWLIILREAAMNRLQHSDGVVVTCSALRHRYRDVIRVATYGHANIHVHFIYLSANEELLMERVIARKDHYMHSNMVRSQLQSLEPPDSEEENSDVLTIDCSLTTEEVQGAALEAVKNKLEEYL